MLGMMNAVNGLNASWCVLTGSNGQESCVVTPTLYFIILDETPGDTASRRAKKGIIMHEPMLVTVWTNG